MKIPRKKKKQIPKGHPYCYDILRLLTPEESSVGGVKIKPCPFYSHKEGLEGYCSVVKCEIIDQCKGCGVGY